MPPTHIDFLKELFKVSLNHLLMTLYAEITCLFGQGLLNRWTSQLDLGCTTGGLERVVSVHNST